MLGVRMSSMKEGKRKKMCAAKKKNKAGEDAAHGTGERRGGDVS